MTGRRRRDRASRRRRCMNRRRPGFRRPASLLAVDDRLLERSLDEPRRGRGRAPWLAAPDRSWTDKPLSALRVLRVRTCVVGCGCARRRATVFIYVQSMRVDARRPSSLARCAADPRVAAQREERAGVLLLGLEIDDLEHRLDVDVELERQRRRRRHGGDVELTLPSRRRVSSS